ncbi:trypsin-like peptidase domain-containing protein [Desulfobotulus mexicanus]|uniref:Trypsin-like serine protease n=1 Tax=Desulfobotulus mexicanus TaxID=2586642 RepID=A0A5Q4VGH2_9BACT|nr:trypsin-like peptidase domain-containing protein [Desulfobotulus mexicanus]TYT75240.1 trypsin-like serine protease [Desulfobotulus mexicanus]
MSNFKTILFFVLAVLLCSSMVSASEIYQFTDEKGVIHFTDNPMKVPGAEYKEIASQGNSHPRGSDLIEILEKKLNPRTAVEQAAMATVRVESVLGIGTGFFISERGHILTNRHVLQQDKAEAQKQREHYRKTEQKLRTYGEQIRQEEQRLEDARKRADDYGLRIPEMHSSQQERARKNLQDEQRNIRERESYLRGIRQEYRQAKDELDKHRRDFEWQNNLAGTQRQVRIGLADGSSLQASIIKISEQHDLALLHLRGYSRTPKMETANPRLLPRGAPLYAIGNPAGLNHSVVNGILSGMEGVWVKTNAKIYPGNSGGPLITQKGEVVGINTFKELTHKFEGLGFALDISVALSDMAGSF